jgi:hypothetical protein
MTPADTRCRATRVPLVLLALLLLVGIVLGIAPRYRGLTENALAAAAVLVLVVTWRSFPLEPPTAHLAFLVCTR